MIEGQIETITGDEMIRQPGRVYRPQTAGDTTRYYICPAEGCYVDVQPGSAECRNGHKLIWDSISGIDGRPECPECGGSGVAFYEGGYSGQCNTCAETGVSDDPAPCGTGKAQKVVDHQKPAPALENTSETGAKMGRSSTGQDDPVLVMIREIRRNFIAAANEIPVNNWMDKLEAAYITSKQPTVKDSLTVQPSDGGEVQP